MSDFEHKPLTGTLFQNDRKETEQQPDYRGEIADESGTVFRVSGWKKQGKNGPWLSLALTRKDEPAKTAGATDQKLEDDAIPF